MHQYSRTLNTGEEEYSFFIVIYVYSQFSHLIIFVNAGPDCAEVWELLRPLQEGRVITGALLPQHRLQGLQVDVQLQQGTHRETGVNINKLKFLDKVHSFEQQFYR